MADFTEVADRVWVARHTEWDVNVTLVGSGTGLLVVDTHGSARAARQVVSDVRRLGAGEVTGIVNTHAHFDHVLGNGTFRDAYGPVPIHAHETAAAAIPHVVAPRGEDAGTAQTPAEPVEPVEPDHTFASAVALDLGDRFVELVHPGRGHTDGDLVVRVPDADVVLAGDLVEESAPPSYGDDCWPLEWPGSLDVLLGLTTASSVVVPGHGAPVDKGFVEHQRAEVGIVAETIRDLAARGVREADALATGEWPWERGRLEHAVRRGYAHLPRGERRLPMA